MVCIGTGDDRAEHDRLVGLVLEVSIPELVELGTHLLQLLFSRTNLISTVSLLGGGRDNCNCHLEASINGVGREASFLRTDLPLLEQL